MKKVQNIEKIEKIEKKISNKIDNQIENSTSFSSCSSSTSSCASPSPSSPSSSSLLIPPSLKEQLQHPPQSVTTIIQNASEKEFKSLLTTEKGFHGRLFIQPTPLQLALIVTPGICVIVDFFVFLFVYLFVYVSLTILFYAMLSCSTLSFVSILSIYLSI